MNTNAPHLLPNLWYYYHNLASQIDQRPYINHTQWNTLRDRHKTAIISAETCYSRGVGDLEIQQLTQLLLDANNFLYETRNQLWTTEISNPVFAEFAMRQSQGLDQVFAGLGRHLNRDFGSTMSFLEQAKAQDSVWLDRFITGVDRASPAPSAFARAYREGNYEQLDRVATQVLHEQAEILSSSPDLPQNDIKHIQDLTGLIMNVTRKRPAPGILLGQRFVGPVNHYRSTAKYDLYRSKFVTGESIMIKALRQNVDKKNINDQIAKFHKHTEIWHSLHSDYTLPFYGIGKWEHNGQTQVYSVAPFLENGDATAYYLTHTVSTVESLQLALDVAQGVQYLHGKRPPFVHFGICTNNVLIDEKQQAVLGGFGLIEEAETNPAPSRTGVSNEHYRFLAPEHLESSAARKPSADVWAWAMVCLELVGRKKPFYNLNDFGAARQIANGNLPKREEYPSIEDLVDATSFWQLLEDCWSYDELKRPQMRDVVPRLEIIVRSNEKQTSRLPPIRQDPTSMDQQPNDGRPERPVIQGQQPRRW